MDAPRRRDGVTTETDGGRRMAGIAVLGGCALVVAEPKGGALARAECGGVRSEAAPGFALGRRAVFVAR